VASKKMVLKCKSEKIIKKAAVKIGNDNNNRIAVIKLAHEYKVKK
jgi:hypothetical protein